MRRGGAARLMQTAREWAGLVSSAHARGSTSVCTGTRDEEMEMGNEKREMKKWLHNCIAITFSNTLWSGLLPQEIHCSGEEVEHMHDRLNTQKVL